MNMKKMNKAVLPAVGLSMAAGAALLMMAKPSQKQKVRKTAGKAIKAVGEAVEHYHGGFKM